MKLEVFFDYTCPFCYVVYQYLQGIKEKYEQIQFEWHPCEAHPHPEPRMVFGKRSPCWWRALESHAEQAGLVMKTPHMPIPHSDQAIRGMYAFADMGGDLWAYHDAVFRAVFVEAQDIEKPAVLSRCAEQAGVDGTEFQRMLSQDKYLQAQKRTNPYAYTECKVWAVPTLIGAGHRLDSVDGVLLRERQIEDFLEKVLADG